MAVPKRYLKRLVWVLMFFAVAVSALLAAGYAALQTETGRGAVARAVGQMLSTPGETMVVVDGIRPGLPGRIGVARIELRDGDGLWAEVENLDVAWRPLSLLSGALDIVTVAAARVHILRRPKKTGAPSDGGLDPRTLLNTRIGNLLIDQVQIDKSVLGTAVAYRAAGALASRDPLEVRTLLQLDGTDGTAGHVRASASYRPDDRTLSVDAAISEPKGGLLAGLLDLPGRPALTLDVQGSGPIADWRGRLDLSIDGMASVAAALRLAGDKTIEIRADGTADIARAVAPPFRRLVSPNLSVELSAQWVPDEMILRVWKARFAGAAGALTLEGTFGLADRSVTAKAAVTLSDPASVNPILAPLAIGGAEASLTADGTLDRPRIGATLVWRGLRGPGGTIGEGKAAITGTFTPARPAAPWTVGAEIDLRSLLLDDPTLADIVGGSAALRLRGHAAIDTGRIENVQLNATAGPFALRGSGAGNLFGATGTANLTVSVDDLAPLSRHVPGPISGRLDLRARLSASREGIAVDIDGAAARLALDPPVLAALLGPAPRLSGHLHRGHDGRIELRDIALVGGGLKATLDASLSPARRIKGQYRIDLPNLSKPAGAVALPAGGAITTSGTIDGPLADPGLAGTIGATALKWQAVDIGSMRGRYDVAHAATRPRGSVSLSGGAADGKMTVATRFEVTRWTTLALSALTVEAAGADLSGELTIPLNGDPLTGALSGRAKTLKPWAAFAGTDVDGTATLDLRLEAKARRQRAALRLDARGVAIGRTLKVGSVRATISSDDVAGRALSVVNITADDVGGAFGKLSHATLSGRGTADALQGSFGAKGDIRGALDISGGIDFERDGAASRLTVRDIKGTAAGHAITMANPGRLTVGATSSDLAVPSLTWAGGSISAGGRVAVGKVSASLHVADLSAAAVSVLVPGLGASGRLTLDASLEGTTSNPSGEMRLTIADVKLKETAAVDLPPLNGDISGQLAKGRFKLRGQIRGIGDAGLQAEADLPVAIDARVASISVSQSAPITAKVTWHGNVAAIAPLLPLGDHLVNGDLSLAMRLAGTLRRPQLTGETAWTGGAYENLRTGTILRKIDLRAIADGQRIAIQRGAATDGNGGMVSLRGSIMLGRGAIDAIDLTTEFKKFAALRRDDMSATASGTIRLRGGADSLKVTGRIAPDVVEARVVDALPPEIVEIAVVETDGGPAGKAAPGVSDLGKGRPGIAIDIEIAMPRRVFVRGRGLDSEWAGDLRITGSAENPIVKGALRSVRGRFDLAGKVFTLGEGRVTFEGSSKIDPILDISAEHKAKRITAVIRITGTASRPKISLSSVPELPQDEVLARVLFDKDVGRLTVGEAAQLASTLATLTGVYGGGAGILDRVRQTLRVDTLRIGKDRDGETTVGVGKYLTEDVYVGVDQGATQKSSNVTVEVTVTPNVTIKSDVGADARSRVGINWKWDY